MRMKSPEKVCRIDAPTGSRLAVFRIKGNAAEVETFEYYTGPAETKEKMSRQAARQMWEKLLSEGWKT